MLWAALEDPDKYPFIIMLAATLADEYELTKRQGEALLIGLVGLITKHLKKGERIRIAAWVSCRFGSAQLGWAVILRPAKRLRSKRARR